MKSCLNFVRVTLMTLATWAQTAIVSAQAPGQEPAASSGKSYVVSYMVVVLAVALGLLVVCRSGGRSNEPTLDDLD